MVVLVADHPEIVAAELEIGLPEAVAVFPLETLGSPRLSWLSYGMVQSGFADDFVDLVMVNRVAFAIEATGNLVGAPFVPSAKFDDFFFEKAVWSRAAGATPRFFL